MEKYSIDTKMSLVAADSLLTYEASSTTALRRFAIYEIMLGSPDAGQDYGAEYEINRFTATGTGTAATPENLDPGGVAALGVAKSNLTVEPTGGGETLWHDSCHQRGRIRWAATPGGELQGPATPANGLALLCVTVSTAFNATATVHFIE